MMIMPSYFLPELIIPIEKIGDFCQRWGIIELSLFGSVLRDDFHDESDVDVLIQFDHDHHYKLSDWLTMGDELETLFERDVDMIDKEALLQSRNYLRRNAILNTAQVIYAR
jgi:predicted nucleotidyltransferase